jgi:hypothetical protein
VITYLNPAVAGGARGGVLHERFSTATAAGFVLILAGSYQRPAARSRLAGAMATCHDPETFWKRVAVSVWGCGVPGGRGAGPCPLLCEWRVRRP